MSEKYKTLDELVDRFVLHVNTHEREPISVNDAPASVLEGPSDEYGYSDWRIRPYEKIDWIDAVEQRLPFRFPYLYRSLVTRYIFPSFCVKLSRVQEIQFLANTPEGAADHELRDRLFWNDTMMEPLLAHGYLCFANPTDGAMFDPLCFDMNRLTGCDDHPIVRFNHDQLFKRVYKKIKMKYLFEVTPSLEEVFLKVIEYGHTQHA